MEILMKRLLSLNALAVLAVACSSNPAGPSGGTTATPPATVSAEGSVSSKQVTVDRIRLRRANGADIATGLTNGQVIDVPLNVNLDIWAEIQRLETDAARLVVDWGNGNSDFSPCGGCRLENQYVAEGRYTVKVSVIDLKAPTESATITSLTVTLNAVDPSRFEDVAGLSCSGVSTDFSAFSFGARSPYAGSGFTITGSSRSRVLFELFPFTLTSGNILFPAGPTTIEFTSDKNFASIAFHHTNLIPPPNALSFKAFNAAGAEVLSGSKTGSIVTLPLTIEDTLTVSGATFRKIVITAPTLYYTVLYFDDLQAGCR
jgi:hypothetical protein